MSNDNVVSMNEFRRKKAQKERPSKWKIMDALKKYGSFEGLQLRKKKEEKDGV